MLERVEASWNEWHCSVHGQRSWKRWVEAEPALEGVVIEDRRSLFNAGIRWGSERHDGIMCALIRLFQAGESEAIEALITGLGGELRMVARQLRRIPIATGTEAQYEAFGHEAFGLVLSGFYLAVQNYDVDTRSSWVASKLKLDTRSICFPDYRRSRRNSNFGWELIAGNGASWDGVLGAETEERTERVEAIALVAQYLEKAYGRKGPETVNAVLRLVVAVWVDGHSIVDAAEHSGWSYWAAQKKLGRTAAFIRTELDPQTFAA